MNTGLTDARVVVALTTSNSAYTQANTATGIAQSGFTQANTATGISQSAFTQANTATTNAATALGVAQSAYTQANTGVTLSGTNSWTGVQTFVGTVGTKTALPLNNIDLSTGDFFTKTISGATTLTVSNVPTTGKAGGFILELTNGGSAVITWWTGVKWASGTAPTLTSAGVDILSFYTVDGGTTWRGAVISKDSK